MTGAAGGKTANMTGAAGGKTANMTGARRRRQCDQHD